MRTSYHHTVCIIPLHLLFVTSCHLLFQECFYPSIKGPDFSLQTFSWINGLCKAYPPGQAPYNPPPATAHTVVVAQPTYPVIVSFREVPVRLKCQYCQADVVTATSYETGTFTWIACLVLCFVGLDLGCCFIPFCLNACKDVVHSCPNCHQTLGRYNRM